MTVMSSASEFITLAPRSEQENLPAYRVAPHNIEAEQELLGAMLVNNDAATKVASFLAPEHFAEPVHGRIYQAALQLIEQGLIASPVTLKTYFERDEALATIGGAGYLARLAAAATAIINAEDYGRLIYDLALRRQLIQIGEEMVNTAYDSRVDQSAAAQIEDAEQQLFTLAEKGQFEGGFQSFTASVAQSIQMIDAAFHRGGLSGVSTGLVDLDGKLGGLHRSDLIILAGRPSMGKTALATMLAFNAAKRHLDTKGEDGAVVGFFSLEMSAEQLATRILAERTELSSAKLRRGEIDDEDFASKLVPASQLLAKLPLFIDDTGALSISALRTRARRLKRLHDVGLVVVDYLQLMRGSSVRANDNRVQEISEITQALKALAKDLDLPIVALSQLSRAVEQRDDKRPQLADLRESGAIEQDADVVMFVYREEYYKRRQEPRIDSPEHAKWLAEMESIHNVAEVIIGKQRHGPIGKVELYFEPEFTRFRDLMPEERLPPPL